MIYIITGKINQGKTSLAYSVYKSNPIGDGFLAPKMYKDKKFVGYHIEHLTKGERSPYIYTKNALPENEEVDLQFRNFVFSRRGLRLAEKIINKCIADKISPVYIDEIGPVELFHKKGLHRPFKRLMKTNCDIIVVIRNFLIDRLIDLYGVRNYKLIKA